MSLRPTPASDADLPGREEQFGTFRAALLRLLQPAVCVETTNQ